MQITIICTDRVYIWHIKPKKRHKVFYKINNQMYKVYTSELKKLHRQKYGKKVESDDCIIFNENSRIPYDTNGTTSYDQDHILEEIDAVKFAYRGRARWGLWGKVGGSGWLWPVLVLGIFGILTAAAFLG